MPTLRSQQILALEKLIADCIALIERGISINCAIRAHKLPLPPLDLHGIHATWMFAEEMLKNLELKAPQLVAVA